MAEVESYESMPVARIHKGFGGVAVYGVKAHDVYSLQLGRMRFPSHQVTSLTTLKR